MSTPLRVLTLAAVVVVYYWFGKALLFRGARRLAAVTRIGPSHWGTAQRADVFELAAAGASHVVVVVALLAVTGIGPGVLVSGLARPDLLVLGVLLGIGELALGSLLCRALIEVSLARRSRTRPPVRTRPPARGTAGAVGAAGAVGPAGPVRVLDPPRPGRRSRRPAADSEDQGQSLRSWLGRSRGGWIRHHLTALKVLPLWAALGLTGVQVASEELVFRGVALTWLRDAGPVVALTTSIVLFVLMQAFFMSSWRGAMFPVVGGVVMGVVHGLVFWTTPFVAPLVVAHVVFFVFAVI
ncbi:type II CAAX prenyl endopeptidase Rce1 family protein [Streptomyces sp. AC512_CC834]|uniref:CPBP family glutamic-type intramembrane protease n=1 Tax=Streptomyces sp. AC512_CC834 TaxID=2823691 RepID=UPI001C272176|nr:CPBP family glutamic-type intramembrane protease [Streptomyces sp. AC512_CC834]